MLPITARNNSTDSRNCARCFSTGNMFEMESIKTHRGGEHVTLFFHPDCFEKYQYAKLAIQKGVSGIEYDQDGRRVNIELTLTEGTKFNKDRELRQLTAMLSRMEDPEAWVKKYLAAKD